MHVHIAQVSMHRTRLGEVIPTSIWRIGFTDAMFSTAEVEAVRKSFLKWFVNEPATPTGCIRIREAMVDGFGFARKGPKE